MRLSLSRNDLLAGAHGVGNVLGDVSAHGCGGLRRALSGGRPEQRQQNTEGEDARHRRPDGGSCGDPRGDRGSERNDHRTHRGGDRVGEEDLDTVHVAHGDGLDAGGAKTFRDRGGLWREPLKQLDAHLAHQAERSEMAEQLLEVSQ